MNSSVYWQGPAKPHVDPLRASVTAEVVVVGGGIAGLTCAQALAERGVDVTLVEQAFCGAGASGKSSGFITPDSELELSDLVRDYGESRGRALWEFARSGVERIRRTISALEIDCNYQIQDSLFVAGSTRALRTIIELEHRTHASLGYRSTVYDRTALAGILGSPVGRSPLRRSRFSPITICRRSASPLRRSTTSRRFSRSRGRFAIATFAPSSRKIA